MAINGICIIMIVRFPIMINTLLNKILELKGTPSSRILVSFENLVRILPVEVVSKNYYFE